MSNILNVNANIFDIFGSKNYFVYPLSFDIQQHLYDGDIRGMKIFVALKL